MSFLQLEGKRVLVCGLANKKSVAWHVGRVLREVGAQVAWSVRTEDRRGQVAKLTGDDPVWVCDVRDDAQIASLAESVAAWGGPLDGLVHSMAFADYSAGPKPFHETPRRAFLEAVDVSCYSLMALAGVLRPHMAKDAAIVTISISTTRMASESYGFMAPAKAALDSSVAFLAKSLSRESRIRVNGVCAGLLKTASSAGIPGYVESYLFAEQATLRKEALATDEVANVAAFLLSPRSSGINAQGIVVDAGMETNYFDRDIVNSAMRQE
jgi:enoyl-[acyl-carrier protein] reductase I